MINDYRSFYEVDLIEERFIELTDGFEAVDVAELFAAYKKNGVDLLEVYNSYDDFIPLP